MAGLTNAFRFVAFLSTKGYYTSYNIQKMNSDLKTPDFTGSNPQPVNDKPDNQYMGSVKSQAIQPVNDMSEYVSQTPTMQPQSVSSSPTAQQNAPNFGPVKPTNLLSVYPDLSQPSVPTSQSDSQQETLNKKQRVASRVPAVQVLAFLMIIYGIYSAISLLSVFPSIFGSRSDISNTGAYNFSLTLVMVFGMAAFYITVGIYLLIAKNIKTVRSLITAVLVLLGIFLANSVLLTARYIQMGLDSGLNIVGLHVIVSLLILAGLFMYLWNVKSQIDLAVLEKN